MNPMQSTLLAGTCQRPQKLYRYSRRLSLERSLQLGEFQLSPPLAKSSDGQILPFGSRGSGAAAGYLTLSLSSVWDESLFDTFSEADCCLVVHQPEEFGERMHRAVQRALPNWAGIDAAMSYGLPSPLGTTFSKHRSHAREKEWLFAWRPTQASLSCDELTVQIGSIEGIAELRYRLS